MYEAFYGLSGKPFQLNPDPNFYFGSRGHKRAFAYLEYGLVQGEGFIVITGEIGAGKTTVVQNLINHLDSERVVAAQLVSTQLDADDLLRSVATAFGIRIKYEDKARMLAEIEAYLTALVLARKRALLIVDEAQNLTSRAIEELRMLSNFQLGNQALLQSFLVGQPGLREIMQSSRMQQLRQRVLASYHLGPMEREETKAYVEHRLTCVGWQGRPRFDSSAYDQIHAFCGGIPRKINTLCNRVLLAAFLGEKQVVAREDIDVVTREITEESGMEVVSGGSAPRSKSSPTSEPSSLITHPVFDLPHWQSGANPSATAELEARIARLERTLSATLDLIYRLIHSGQDRPKPKDVQEQK
ncbi:MAG: XrtA/PEP-CTERM system-associated ATPase [Burkholderiales bacterium]